MRRSRTFGAGFFSLLVVLSFSWLAIGCESREVMFPDSDRSPPDEVVLQAFVNSLDSPVTVTNFTLRDAGPVVLQPHDWVILVASATDDEGVRSIRISGSSSLACSGEEERPTQIITATNPDEGAAPGGTVHQFRSTVYSFRVKELIGPCRRLSLPVESLFLSFAATGENFHGGSRGTRVISFTYTGR